MQVIRATISFASHPGVDFLPFALFYSKGIYSVVFGTYSVWYLYSSGKSLLGGIVVQEGCTPFPHRSLMEVQVPYVAYLMGMFTPYCILVCHIWCLWLTTIRCTQELATAKTPLLFFLMAVLPSHYQAYLPTAMSGQNAISEVLERINGKLWAPE